MEYKNSLLHREEEPEKGVLYIVGTPIGNLSDISFRALHILQNVSLIACEDTRQTKKLMNKFELNNVLISFNRINSYKKIPKLIKSLKDGKSIALVSDAGMPSICDPGEELINKAKHYDIDTICVPGPCAAITALVSSGMPSSSFIFEGFLPKKKVEREKTLLSISKREQTTILFESPRRLLKLLYELKKFCGGEREIQVSRELTKKFEENISQNINYLIQSLKDKEILGEITLVIKGISKSTSSDIDESFVKKELDELVKAGLSLSSASKYLAKKLNIPKNMIYNLD